MNTAELFHVMFYFSGIVGIMIGSYSLYMNPRAKLNRAFFSLCLSLFIWAIGFSMAIDANSLAQCIFWRRVSAVGWGSLFGFLLHFCIVFSKNYEKFKEKWLHPLIYAPSVIIVYIFGISSSAILSRYNLKLTSAGWINIANNNVWDLIFILYYVGYNVIGLALLWQYGKKSNSEKVKKQVKLILSSFLVALIIGSVTDIVCNSIFSINIPQVAPIIILIPVVTIYYSIIRYGLMSPKENVVSAVIMTDSTRVKVYTNLFKVFIAGSILSYIVQYFDSGNLIKPLYSSLFVLLFGLIIYSLNSLNISDYVKDLFLIGIIFIAIPSITLIFVEYGSITVWTIAFLFILVAMVFNKPIVLLSVSTSILSTEVLIWILKPKVNIVIDGEDYVGRLGVLLITIWFSYYVNKIYIRRIQKNANQLSLQRFISEVSSDFINVKQTNIDDKMYWVLKILGKLFSIENINILVFDTEKCECIIQNVWNRNKENIEDIYEQGIPREDISWMLSQLNRNEYIYIPDIDKLPVNAVGVRESLIKRHISSLVAMNIEEKNSKLRILEFCSSDKTKKWKDEEVRVLNIIANIFDDAIMKVEAEKEITHMAYHDHLTGLANRRLFKDRLNQAIELAKRTEKMIGIVFIDLDSFKTINDTIGHEGGDALIKMVSMKLTQTVRLSDTVSRFGGDEFLIMLNNISEENDIVKIADKIMSVLNQTFIVHGQEFSLTTSAGIAIYPFDGTDMDTLVKNADIAMYKAKEKGKKQYVICSSELKEEILERIKITNNLHRALERNEFYLNYQPQVELSSGKIIGIEALIRWKNPQLGFVSPAVFIPIAEQIGKINEIGEWVLKTACAQNKKWQDAGYEPICMAVNVSAYQLRSLSFVDKLNMIVNETGLNTNYLEVEITESAAMSETGDVAAALNEIQRIGVKISIDDFGTDYSSLNRLKALPIDKIKIDKQFVDEIEDGEKDKAIVRTIISLAKNLDLKVIAEGVENEKQLKFLRMEMCDEIQGYFYYKPMSAEDIEMILQKNSDKDMLNT